MLACGGNIGSGCGRVSGVCGRSIKRSGIGRDAGSGGGGCDGTVGDVGVSMNGGSVRKIRPYRYIFHRQFSCCGVAGPSDWVGSWWHTNLTNGTEPTWVRYI